MQTAIHTGPRRTQAARVKRFRFFAPLAIAAFTGAVSFAALTGFGDSIRAPGPVMGELDRAAEWAGFGLSQVQVTGHKFTSDSAILNAVGLEAVRSLVRFDAVAARERIERLPWVATATITRLLPDGLAITIVERTPAAVWQQGTFETLIDGEGRKLTAVRPGAAPDLPRVAGTNAPEASPGLFQLLSSHPDLLGRLLLAERVAERRWTLHLTGDLRVLLPVTGADRAIEILMQRVNGRRLADAGAGQLDLRTPGRVVAEPLARPPVTPLRPKQSS